MEIHAKSLPRARGGDSVSMPPAGAVTPLFPAHAGVIPIREATAIWRTSLVPAHAGVIPAGMMVVVLALYSSPRTRG